MTETQIRLLCLRDACILLSGSGGRLQNGAEAALKIADEFYAAIMSRSSGLLPVPKGQP